VVISKELDGRYKYRLNWLDIYRSRESASSKSHSLVINDNANIIAYLAPALVSATLPRDCTAKTFAKQSISNR
jgi:hypothetical protein